MEPQRKLSDFLFKGSLWLPCRECFIVEEEGISKSKWFGGNSRVGECWPIGLEWKRGRGQRGETGLVSLAHELSENSQDHCEAQMQIVQLIQGLVQCEQGLNNDAYMYSVIYYHRK